MLSINYTQKNFKLDLAQAKWNPIQYSFDFFNPKNDEHLVSPDHIAPKSYIKVTRIKENDHQLKKLWIVKQIFFVSTLGNV